MARTLEEIREKMSAQIMNLPVLVKTLGLDSSKKFEEQVSSVNLIKLLLDVVAAGIYFHEQVFERDKAEMIALLQTKRPHQLQWYRDKALVFQYGPSYASEDMRNLFPDTDEFDNTDIEGTNPEAVIERERIVKYAAAVERGGRVYIKVAKGEDDAREPLAPQEVKAVEKYFSKIKDAGVIVEIVSRKADELSLALDIYYDPMILDEAGNRLDGEGQDTVRETIKKFVQNLPFDGVYKNSALIDRLQKLPGVVIPEIRSAEYRYGTNWLAIDAKVQPDSGYFKIYEEGEEPEKQLRLNFIAYDANN